MPKRRVVCVKGVKGLGQTPNSSEEQMFRGPSVVTEYASKQSCTGNKKGLGAPMKDREVGRDGTGSG